jgi:hypothetical protein
MLPICERGLEHLESVERATIQVEHATGPILLVSGGDDEVWATGRMCEMVVNRMAQHGRAGDVRHVHYPQARHMLFPSVRPADVMVPVRTSHLRRAGATP